MNIKCLIVVLVFFLSVGCSSLPTEQYKEVEKSDYVCGISNTEYDGQRIKFEQVVSWHEKAEHYDKSCTVYYTMTGAFASAGFDALAEGDIGRRIFAPVYLAITVPLSAVYDVLFFAAEEEWKRCNSSQIGTDIKRMNSSSEGEFTGEVSFVPMTGVPEKQEYEYQNAPAYRTQWEVTEKDAPHIFQIKGVLSDDDFECSVKEKKVLRKDG